MPLSAVGGSTNLLVYLPPNGEGFAAAKRLADSPDKAAKLPTK